MGAAPRKSLRWIRVKYHEEEAPGSVKVEGAEDQCERVKIYEGRDEKCCSEELWDVLSWSNRIYEKQERKEHWIITSNFKGASSERPTFLCFNGMDCKF